MPRQSGLRTTQTLGECAGFRYHDPALFQAYPFGQKVALLLLTPGRGYVQIDFANSLPEAVFFSNMLSSSEYTNRLLKRLTNSRDTYLAKRAAEVLADCRYWDQRRRRSRTDGTRRRLPSTALFPERMRGQANGSSAAGR